MFAKICLTLLVIAYKQFAYADSRDSFVNTYFDGVHRDSQGYDAEPPDLSIAVNDAYIVTVTNAYIDIYDKSNNSLIERREKDEFFNITYPPNAWAGDPRIIYDISLDRWIIIYIMKTDASVNPVGRTLLAVSHGADPRGENWYTSNIDLTPTIDSFDTRPDYPGLGIDSEAIYITTDQYYYHAPFNENILKACNVRIIDKSIAYQRAITESDCNDILLYNDNHDPSNAVQTLKPVKFYNHSGTYFINTQNKGGSYVNLWYLSNPLTNPTINVVAEIDGISGGSFSPYSEIITTGLPLELKKLDCRSQDIVFHNDHIYNVFNEWSNNLIAIRLLDISVENYNPDSQGGYIYYEGHTIPNPSNIHMTYPGIAIDPDKTCVIPYTRFDNSNFTEPGYTIAYSEGVLNYSFEHKTFQVNPIQVEYDGERWGDYSDAWLDPDGNAIWTFSMYNSTVWEWNTIITEVVTRSSTEFRNDFEGISENNGTLNITNYETGNSYYGILSGTGIDIPINSDLFVTTVDQKFINHNGSGIDYMHRQWDIPTERYFSDSHVIPYLIIDEKSCTYTRLYSVPIQCKNEKDNILTNLIQIQDPWLKDETTNERFLDLNNAWVEITDHNSYDAFLDQNHAFGPAYKIKAPTNPIALSDGIYIFDHWEGINVQIQYNLENETFVIFNNPNASVSAIFHNVLEDTEFTLSTSNLEIPSGAHYHVKDGFRFIVDGGKSLTISGTNQDQVIIEPVEDPRSETSWEGIKVNYGNILVKNTVLRSATVGIDMTLHVVKDIRLFNNTFVYNTTAVRIDRDNGAPGDVELTNNIFAHNGAGVSLHDSYPPLYQVDMNYNLIFDNEIDIYEEQSSLYNESGSVNYFNQNPEFVSDQEEEGDFHLEGSSYAINGGDPDYDDDGDDYIIDSDDQDPDGTRIDMGAYYFNNPPDNPPSTPSGFSIAGAIGEYVQLSWNKNIEHDMKEYKIYRKLTDSQSTYHHIATVTHPTNNYTDPNVQVAADGGKFTPLACYKVSAIDLSDQESNKTSQKCKPYVAYKELVSEELLPVKYALHNNYPNPFNPVTTISFDLPEYSFVELNIHNLNGQLITILENKNIGAGYKSIQWNGFDKNGKQVSSGVYLYTIKAKSLESGLVFMARKKMIFLK